MINRVRKTRVIGKDKKSTRVYEDLKARIAAEEFVLAGKLPSELHLAERFAVSRGVVREALALLRQDQLIHSNQGSGSFIRWHSPHLKTDFAPLTSIEDVKSFYEFRLFLEGEAAALAAIRRSSADLKLLRKSLAALDDIINSGAVGSEADFQFHEMVARASHNYFFVSAVTSVQHQIKAAIEFARRLSLTKHRRRLEVVQFEHRSILKAIETGDSERARLSMRTHIVNARNRIFQG